MDNEARSLIDDAVAIVSCLLHSEETEVPILRTEAIILLDRLHAFMIAFGREHGPSVACPVIRAWCLLDLAMKHRTLLRAPIGIG